MWLDSSVRRRLWLQNLYFLALFGLVIGLLAWLSARYAIQADWTAGNRNTLSEASQALLARLDGPIRVTAYARDNPALRDGISRLIGRYQHYKSDLTLVFVNPDLLPDRVRELGITLDGELHVEYRDRGEKIQQLGERAMTQALQRLSRPQDRVVLFLDGHGERKPHGVANHDLGSFGRELEKIGIRSRPIDLAKEPRIPAAAVLVVASPQTPVPAGEIAILLKYVEQGGNLLWLLEPDDLAGLRPLAATLGIAVLPGVVVDADTPRLGIGNPSFIPVADYGPHPITELLRSPALLPQAVALEIQPTFDWKATVLLESQSRTWTETDPLNGPLQFDPDTDERAGPLTVGVALFRPRPTASTGVSAPEVATQQRAVVIGDGDFLSNTYLGNGTNLELGLNILNWLTLDDALIVIHPNAAPDPNLNLSEGALALIAAVFLIVLPSALLASGWLIWFRRRRR